MDTLNREKMIETLRVLSARAEVGLYQAAEIYSAEDMRRDADARRALLHAARKFVAAETVLRWEVEAR